MKNLFFVLTLLFSLTFVSADLLQVNNFVYNSNSISNVGVLGFSCTTADCSSGQTLFLNSNSGSNSFFDVAYPNSGQNTNYGLFVFKDGYIPYERTSTGYEDLSGDKRVDAVNDHLTRKTSCSSNLTNLIVTNNSNVVTVKTTVSAPISHSGGLNFVPSQIASQYSVNVTLLLKINGSVNQTKIINLPFSGSSEQEFVVTLPSGNYNLEIESVSNDAKCLSSNNQTKTSSINLVNNTVPPTTCNFVYNPWSACVNGQQTRTVNSSFPSGCVGGSPILTQSCNNSNNQTNQTNNTLFSVNITNPINNSILNSTITSVNYTINGTATSCWYVLNGQSSVLENCLNKSIGVFNGTNNLSVFVSNGNSTINDSISFFVNLSSSNDTTAPVIVIHSPLNTTYSYSNISINVSIDEQGLCGYNLNNGTNKTFSFENYFSAYENLSNGNYLLSVFCQDLVGNFASKNVSFKVNVSDDEDEDDDSNKKKSSGTGYVLPRDANETIESLVLNEKQRETSPWALFLILLLLCTLVLFFIVLVLLVRDRNVRNQ